MYTLDGRTVLQRPGISVLRHVSGACPDVSVYRFAAQRSPAQRSAPRSNVAWNVRSPLRSTLTCADVRLSEALSAVADETELVQNNDNNFI